MLEVGDKFRFSAEVQRYTIRARDNRFIIMTKPFNLKRTYFYTIVDLDRGGRGDDNLLFGSDEPYNTTQGAVENLRLLQTGYMEVSRRNFVSLPEAELQALSATI